MLEQQRPTHNPDMHAVDEEHTVPGGSGTGEREGDTVALGVVEGEDERGSTHEPIASHEPVHCDALDEQQRRPTHKPEAHDELEEHTAPAGISGTQEPLASHQSVHSNALNVQQRPPTHELDEHNEDEEHTAPAESNAHAPRASHVATKGGGVLASNTTTP